MTLPFPHGTASGEIGHNANIDLTDYAAIDVIGSWPLDRVTAGAGEQPAPASENDRSRFAP